MQRSERVLLYSDVLEEGVGSYKFDAAEGVGILNLFN